MKITDATPLSYRFNEDAQLNVVDDCPNGSLEGYLAVFGNVDLAGEVIQAGAFAKTLSERMANGATVPLMQKHEAAGGGAADVIDTITRAYEDSYGLRIRAEFAATEDAQKIRSKVRDGHIKGLSVGYHTISQRRAQVAGKTVTVLTEMRLREGTVTPFPCNESAVILDAKTTNQPRAAESTPALADWRADLAAMQVAIAERQVRIAQLHSKGVRNHAHHAGCAC